MRGFQPAAVEQQFADGGTVGFLKRAFGMAPKLYPSALDEQRQAQQRAQQQSKQPQEPQQQPSGVGALPRDYLRNPGAVLKRREQEAGLKDGGRVRPRGFVSGPGTQTSDSIPARLSDGEYVLPADTVRAVGVGKLDALRDATHTPASGFSAKQDREFFLADGGVASLASEEERLRRQNKPSADPFASMVSNTGGLQQRALASVQAGEQARADEQARKAAVAAGQANPSFIDVLTASSGQFGEPTDAQKTVGITAAPVTPTNQASVNGAPAVTSNAPTTNSPDLEDVQRRSKQALEPAAASAVQPGSQGSQIMPGVYSHGRGQYSDNQAGMGFSPGFTGQPSVQNMAAADALAARSRQESANRVLTDQAAQQPQGFQAPVVRSSLNDWQIRNNLRNLETSAKYGPLGMPARLVARMGAKTPEAQAYLAARQADLKAQGLQPEADLATMRENAGLQRTGMEQAGANQRAAYANALGQDRLALDNQRFGLDAQAKGFDIRQARRKEGVLQRYDAAKTDDERAALVKQFPDVFGKQDGNWKLQVTPATKNMDGSTSEGSVIRYNDRTGQVERVNLDGQQQSGPSGVPNIGDVRGGYRYKGGNPNNQASWEKL